MAIRFSGRIHCDADEKITQDIPIPPSPCYTKKKVMPALLLLALLSASLLAPLPAEAGLIPCGLTVDDPALAGDQTVRCTLCHLVVGVSSIVSFLRNLMFAIAIAVIVAMAFIYITSSGDEGRMRFAKGGIIAALVGFAVILLAWVVVNFILTLPIFNTSNNLIRTGWDSVQCQTSSLSAGATTPMATGGGGGSASGGAGGTSDDVVTVPRGDTGTPETSLLPAPTGLVANAPSTSTATISWTPAAGSSSGTVYHLERCTGLTCTIFTPIATVTGTSYTNTGLAAGTGYSYRVRAVTASGELSNWSNVTRTTTVADPISNPGTPPDNPGTPSTPGTPPDNPGTPSTPGTPPNGTCVGPGTPQYLLGKSWVSNRINPDGTPIRTEVSFVGSAANNNLSMNLTIICQMSALGHGNDLSPGVTALIQNATASTFDIVPNYEQTLTNNRGYTCTVRTVTETATYTPLSDTTMRLFGLDFTGTCMGSSAP